MRGIPLADSPPMYWSVAFFAHKITQKELSIHMTFPFCIYQRLLYCAAARASGNVKVFAVNQSDAATTVDCLQSDHASVSEPGIMSLTTAYIPFATAKQSAVFASDLSKCDCCQREQAHKQDACHSFHAHPLHSIS